MVIFYLVFWSSGLVLFIRSSGFGLIDQLGARNGNGKIILSRNLIWETGTEFIKFKLPGGFETF